LLLLVPIIDIRDSRPVIRSVLAVLAAALTCAALASSARVFLVAVFWAGLSTSVIQKLVPTIAALTPPARRGKVIGDVMSGLMLGIKLSRPLASFATAALAWRSFYAA
jgi:predicted MFS family arabinose efflux permease